MPSKRRDGVFLSGYISSLQVIYKINLQIWNIFKKELIKKNKMYTVFSRIFKKHEWLQRSNL